MNYRDGRLLAATLVLCFSAVGYTQDASSVLREVDQALGVSSLKSIRYAGNGFAYAFLQNARPDARYPKFYAKYTRSIDFEKGLSREETTRSQFENPAERRRPAAAVHRYNGCGRHRRELGVGRRVGPAHPAGIRPRGACRETDDVARRIVDRGVLHGARQVQGERLRQRAASHREN